jgi:hypothetical protein
MNVTLDGWVVYAALAGKHPGARAVCRQHEWEAMQLRSPGRFAFIQGAIPSEAEAERLARGSSGEDAVCRPPKARWHGRNLA